MRTLILLTALVAVFLPAAVTAQVPHLVNYQGRLTDNDGNPVPDGQYNITFNIYQHDPPPMGEGPIWSSGIQAVSVTNGLFSYVLGSNVPMPHWVFADTDWDGHFLRVGVEGNMLTSVEQLVAVPFAYKAIVADTANYAITGGSGSFSGWVDNGTVVRLETYTDLVGIGTNSPHAPLVVGKDLGSYLGQYVVSGSYYLDDVCGYKLGYNTDNHATVEWNGDGAPLAMHTRENGTSYNNTLVLSSGNVGIRATHPSEPLVVGEDLGSFYGDRIVVGDNTAGAQTGLVLGENNNNRGWLLWDIDGNYMSMGQRDIGTAHNNVLVLKDGKVGIGTTNPFGPLHVAGRAICDELQLLGGADLAEPFEMSGGEVPAGALVVIDDLHPGKLKLSYQAYDTRVAGVVSGAGGVKPGLTLSQKDVFDEGRNVAMNGRVYCLADASYGPITPGDLLTTSDTPGHAMRAADRNRAYGSVIGKAMSRLEDGTGLVLVLVNLQ